MKEYLFNHANKTANRRKRIYGIDPSCAIEDLLAREPSSINFGETIRLLIYILLKSPRRRLELIWQRLTDKDTVVRRYQIDLLAKELKRHLSKKCRVATNYFERRNYSKDLARVPSLMEILFHRTTPYLVVQPENEIDILNILAFSRSNKMAVFPRGTGSFAFGGAVPTRKGIVIDLSPMMDILEIDPSSMTVRVQPGARWADITNKLNAYDLAPKTTPTSLFSTVGGWVSTGGMGLDSYAYGNVNESIVKVRVARPNGTIDELTSNNESIQDLFGTEGQFGILTEITLKVRPKPEHNGTCLFGFNDPELAFEFIDKLTPSDFYPSHVVFFDKEYMKKENILFKEQTGLNEPIVLENHTVLLHFDEFEKEKKFLSSLNGKTDNFPTNNISAQYLWSDRYFPLKAQRISPGLLGSEVVIPREKIPIYISNVRSLAQRFRLDPTIEVIVCREGRFYLHLVIISFNCDYSKSIHYILSLLFIQLLVRMAVRHDGHPYGVGIWNTPFVRSKYYKGQLEKLKRKKHEIDPGEMFNPYKFFKIKGRFFNIPALILRPIIFHTILTISHFFSPTLGLIARFFGPKHTNKWKVPSENKEQGKALLHQSAQRCTSCGACISVCPAYHITKDELVAGRTKLRMAETIINKGELKPSEAHSSFQCLHCGLCEEVCQTHLPLRDCYLVLENMLEKQFGSPTEILHDFIEKLDSNQEFIKDVFGLDLPDWSPEQEFSRVPTVERSIQGGEE